MGQPIYYTINKWTTKCKFITMSVLSNITADDNRHNWLVVYYINHHSPLERNTKAPDLCLFYTNSSGHEPGDVYKWSYSTSVE